MSSFVPAAVALQDSLVGLDPRVFSGEDAASGVEVLARTAKVVSAACAKLAARAAECGAHSDKGFSTPTEWIARETGDSVGQARQDLELAAGLENLSGDTRAAVEAGDVSLKETAEIAKTEAECPGSEAEMLDEARRRGLRGLKELGRKKRQEAHDPDELARKRRKARHLRHWVDDLGMIRGQFALEPQIGVPFVKRLDAEIDRAFRSGDAEYRAEPREARAADALSTLLEGKGRPHSTRPELLAVYNVNDHTAHLPGVGPIDMATVRHLAKDAIVTLVTHDGDKVDAYSRHTRHIPKWLRVLIEMGAPPDFDGFTCIDCGRRYHLELDHFDPRANHGPTSRDNIGPRCPHCHRAKTERDRRAGLLDGNRKQHPRVEQSTFTERAPP